MFKINGRDKYTTPDISVIVLRVEQKELGREKTKRKKVPKIVAFLQEALGGLKKSCPKSRLAFATYHQRSHSTAVNFSLFIYKMG